MSEIANVVPVNIVEHCDGEHLIIDFTAGVREYCAWLDTKTLDPYMLQAEKPWTLLDLESESSRAIIAAVVSVVRSDNLVAVTRERITAQVNAEAATQAAYERVERIRDAGQELLDACKALDAAFCEGFDTREGRHKGRLALIVARAAIAKATGAQ